MHKAVIIPLLCLMMVVKLINMECGPDAEIFCTNNANVVDCRRAHRCCRFCYQQNFSGISRCFVLNNSANFCDPKFIVESSDEYSNNNSIEIIHNETFTENYSEKKEKVIQLKPQEFNIYLTKDKPVNLTIEYRSTKDYPLNLYYLMDLTRSMKDDLAVLTKLGQELTTTLTGLTKNHEIAFGSYVDKAEMPFYFMDEQNYKNPCDVIGDTCEKGYLFKHRLNFTKNIEIFSNEVNSSKISANVDNLEGGMDALMQILLCKKELGWSEESRKIVILATESEMHFAGDGILLGATRRNSNKECLIDSKGEYKNPLLYDYPSLEEIHGQLKERKINIIIAAKENIYQYYKYLNRLVYDWTYLVKLEEKSDNILNLVKEGYHKFAERVTLSPKQNIDGIEVDFFVDCENNDIWNKSDTCYGVTEGKTIRYRAQLLLKKYKEINKTDVLHIEEKNIQDNITINIKYPESMIDCPMPTAEKQCQHDGKSLCGNCICAEGWSGDLCQNPCSGELNKCRYTDEDGVISGRTCSGRGDCVCGKCSCDFPYSGKYCGEECPVDNRKICGGPGHGNCVNGTCKCEDGFAGDACNCPTSKKQCEIPGDDESAEVCNGFGTCECNRCKCNKGYSGKFCENCQNCDGMCNNYTSCVEDLAKGGNETCVQLSSVKATFVKELAPRGQTCYHRFYKGNEHCEIRYTYMIKKDYIEVQVEKEECSVPISASVSTAIVIGAILGFGILGLIIWKVCTLYRDKIEYQRFEKERRLYDNNRQQNPLYKDPVVRYNNPMRSQDSVNIQYPAGSKYE